MTVPSGPKMLSELVAEEFGRIERAFEDRNRTGGVPTGLHELDHLVDGIHPGDIIMVAGRPLMGKSDFLFNMAVKFAKETARTVGIFSLRLDQEMVGRRMLVAESKIPLHRLVGGRLVSRDWPRLARATGFLADLPVHINACSRYTDEQILGFITTMKTDQDLGLVVVDGLELMTAAGKHASRRAEAAALIRVIRDFARENQVPVIVSITTSPQGDLRPDSRPAIADLEEWEPLAANAANMVLFLYRPEAYLVYTPDKGVAEVIVAKNNYGETGTVQLTYSHNQCRFENLTEGLEEYIPTGDDEE